MKARIITIILLGMYGMGLVACGNLQERGVDTKAVADEVKNREIKHITQAQIEETTYQWGNAISSVAQKNLVAVLTQALAKYPLEEAAAYCQVSRLTQADSMSRAYEAALKRASLRDLPIPAKLTDMEHQLLDAYLYNAQNKLPQRANVQRIGDKQLLYTTPIVLDNPLCLRCHGEVGSQLSAIDQQKLTARYRLDSLTNRKPQELIGMWSVNFSKKELIKRIDVK